MTKIEIRRFVFIEGSLLFVCQLSDRTVQKQPLSDVKDFKRCHRACSKLPTVYARGAIDARLASAGFLPRAYELQSFYSACTILNIDTQATPKQSSLAVVS